MEKHDSHVSETFKRFLNLQLEEGLTSFNKNDCVNFSGKKRAQFMQLPGDIFSEYVMKV